MNFMLKKAICSISAIAMLSTMGTSYIFADELLTIGASDTQSILNDFDKPLMPDGIHGDTNLEDMQYIHYDLTDIQDTLDAITNLANADYTEENLSLLLDLETQVDTFYVKLSNSYSLIYLYYNQDPTVENLIEYTSTSTLSQEFISEYQNSMKAVMSGSFGTAFLNDLKSLISEDDVYFNAYIYYCNFLISDAINEVTQEVQNKINDKLNEYFTLIQTDISTEEVSYNDTTITYQELLSNYTNLYVELSHNYSDVSEVPQEKLDDYYAMEDAINTTKKSFGIDNDTLTQLYIDIVKLYNEYATTSGSYNYIDLNYQYDLGEINQISSDVKEYVIPILENYKTEVNDNPIFSEVKNLEFTTDEAKDISNTIISSVGSEYVDIYNYMTNHNLLVLDDDYIYSQGYTTNLPEYSQAYIYLTFENNDVFNWFTNGIAHEFGHFIDWYNNPNIFAQSGMATAENISVSFSYIANDNLDAYFDDTTATALTVANTINNSYTYLNSTLSLNELELYAFQNSDTITVDELNQKYLDIEKDYGLINDISYQLGGAKELSWIGQCNQLYTTPFYMVDYALSGLSALTVFDTYTQDNQAGLDLFDKLYSNDYYTSDYVTMMNEGLGIDIYADDYVKNVANTLDTYLSEKIATLPEIEYKLGDINLDGEVKSNDLLMLKKYLLGLTTLEEGSQALLNADMTGDGNVKSNDLLMLKKLLLGLL